MIGRMRRSRRWMGAAVALCAVLLLGYATRREWKRGLVAAAMARTHVFTPPPALFSESRWERLRETAEFYWDFAQFRLARERRLEAVNPELRPLVREMSRRQAAGEDMKYSMHIYREIRWRLNFTPDVAGTRAEIERLRRSLEDAEDQKLAAEQQEPDGSWGMGIDEWYLRLYYSVEQAKACQAPARYPLKFLDRINTPEKLIAVLDADLRDEFTKTGVFNREETDETFSAIARLLLAKKPTSCYNFDPRLRAALTEFVRRWQNPATGCWGQWLVDRDGRIWKMDDMGMTFHVVSDLHGAVEHKEIIARRVLELDRVNFPAGILFDGHYENHLNWDAVKIFRMAWPAMDAGTREKARKEIAGMLRWCLKESYQRNGSFKVSELDDTAGDAYRYGIWFLEETGYFEPKMRFWTDEEFPQASEVKQRIETRLLATGLKDPAMQEAYATLRGID